MSGLQVRALRAGKPAGPAGQPLGSGNSSSLGTGSYGPGASTLGLNADANGLLNAIINRLPPGSLSGETSPHLPSPVPDQVCKCNPASPGNTLTLKASYHSYMLGGVTAGAKCCRSGQPAPQQPVPQVCGARQHGPEPFRPSAAPERGGASGGDMFVLVSFRPPILPRKLP